MNSNNTHYTERSSELARPLIVGTAVLGTTAAAIELASSMERAIETGLIATLATGALHLAARSRKDS